VNCDLKVAILQEYVSLTTNFSDQKLLVNIIVTNLEINH